MQPSRDSTNRRAGPPSKALSGRGTFESRRRCAVDRLGSSSVGSKHLEKGTPGESRCRKATGPRLLRDEHLATKDPKTAELPKGRWAGYSFVYKERRTR